jgi:hypothetical protein
MAYSDFKIWRNTLRYSALRKLENGDNQALACIVVFILAIEISQNTLRSPPA